MEELKLILQTVENLGAAGMQAFIIYLGYKLITTLVGVSAFIFAVHVIKLLVSYSMFGTRVAKAYGVYEIDSLQERDRIKIYDVVSNIKGRN